MKKRKPWNELTPEEMGRITYDVCIKHNCPYRTRGPIYKSIKVRSCLCGYMFFTGRRRGCDPRDCTHWNEKVDKSLLYLDENNKLLEPYLEEMDTLEFKDVLHGGKC